ncbi:MAG: AAA family ATPase [Candidatus Methanospirare jalkutatii]|nr:MAG: AAA family ATPase [Candidatus Methanospirare jalkutatii]
MHNAVESCHPLWLEKFRPMRLDDILGQEKVKERVRAFLRRKMLPNLLLFGERGVGKTSLVFAIARELFGDFWRENLLRVECSDFNEHRREYIERDAYFSKFYNDRRSAVEIFKRAIREYAGLKPINASFRIIFFNNADLLPADIQQSLRRTMERFNKTCRFIFSTTKPSAILPAIRSRCLCLFFKRLDAEQGSQGEKGEKGENALRRLLLKVAKAENLHLTEGALSALEEHADGDAGLAVSILEASASASSLASASGATGAMGATRASEGKKKDEDERKARIIDRDVVEAVVRSAFSQRRRIAEMLNDAFLGDAEKVRRHLKLLTAVQSEREILAEIHAELRRRLMQARGRQVSEIVAGKTAKRAEQGEQEGQKRESVEREEKWWRMFANIFLCESETDFNLCNALNGSMHLEEMLLRFGSVLRES